MFHEDNGEIMFIMVPDTIIHDRHPERRAKKRREREERNDGFYESIFHSRNRSIRARPAIPKSSINVIFVSGTLRNVPRHAH